MSPTFAALLGLGLSTGYNKMQSYSMAAAVDAPVRGVQFDSVLTNNFNFMALMIFVPLLIALFCWLFQKLEYFKERQNLLKLIGNYCLFEYTFYGYLFNAYVIDASLLIAVKYLTNTDAMGPKAVGLLFGALLLILGILYFLFFSK